MTAFLRPHILSAALLALTLAAPAAQAFSDDEARRAILELRTQLKQMNDQNLQARLQLADQMDLLHQEIATLRGRIEELSQHAAPANNSNAPQTPQTGDPQEQAAYEAAADQYRNGRYKEAAAAFSTFLQSYPDSSLAGDAQFYLGSSQYASKDFKHSIQTMQSLVKNRPADPRAPDALLVVAADQIELNDLKGAKASLQRIIKDYPGSASAETAKNRLKLL
ncbi:MAG: tol-pal system protein YbgF [Castellaniella sp.]|uniref:tol-pal system protein YbgF n=1 Tax=Castellaniella sp. TaxID=1955812 RepID=UPI002A36FBB7|nr:tol-pal system protein YbgF [Castellaniella sp.]MDY0309206.1 tol-pal system protein YbgF [Castellaniella sp.]